MYENGYLVNFRKRKMMTGVKIPLKKPKGVEWMKSLIVQKYSH